MDEYAAAIGEAITFASGVPPGAVSNFVMALPVIWVIGTGAGAALITAGKVVIAAAVVGGAVALGYNVYSKNQVENKQFDEAVRRIERILGKKLSKDQIRRLHDEISKGGYGLDDIVSIGIGLFGSP